MVKGDFIINKGISKKNRQRIARRGTCTGGQKKIVARVGKCVIMELRLLLLYHL